MASRGRGSPSDARRRGCRTPNASRDGGCATDFAKRLECVQIRNRDALAPPASRCASHIFSGTRAGRIWDASPIKWAGRGPPRQPGGLPDGSRGSRRRHDPRSWAVRVCTPERGARNTYAWSRPPAGIPPGCKTQAGTEPGVSLRSTPGYLLSSLRDEPELILARGLRGARPSLDAPLADRADSTFPP